MKHRTLASLLLGWLLSGQVMASPMLYADYLNALDAPVSADVQQYVADGAQPERVMNIVLKQRERVDEDTLAVFIANLDAMTQSSDYQKYQKTLHQMSIQTLMEHGHIKAGIEAIERLSVDEQPAYHLLWVAGLTQMQQKEAAVSVFNNAALSRYDERPDDYLDLAQEMVVNHGVASDALRLPAGGETALAQKLVDFYDDNGIYGLSYHERERLLRWEPDAKVQQALRQRLVMFAQEHDLVQFEVEMMEEYLSEASIFPITDSDFVTLNAYSDTMVRYHADPRNPLRKTPETIEVLLAAQKLAGEQDAHSHLNYLKNRTYLYQQTRPEFYYTDVVELGVLTQERARIAGVYEATLPVERRRALLEGYFSIEPAQADADVFMATEYASLIAQCDEQVPALVRLMKAHQWVQASDVPAAYACFEGTDWDAMAPVFTPEVYAGLQSEQAQVAYAHAKQQGDELQVLTLAKESADSTLHLDAMLFAVTSAVITESRLSELDQLRTELALTPEQQLTVDGAMEAQLRSGDDTVALMTFLARTPKAHALELAYWSMDNDDTPAALTYAVMRLEQPDALSAYDEVKLVRYLDSVYETLSDAEQIRLSALPQASVRAMLALQAQETTLTQAFASSELSLPQAVQAALGEYQQWNTTLTASFSEANYTAQIWLLSQMERQFADYLSALAQDSDEAFGPVLLEQAAQHQQLSEQYLTQLLSLKVDGVFDLRVWMASAALMEEA